jgi:uncharacterized protein YbjQ (UPF0145 family)
MSIHDKSILITPANEVAGHDITEVLGNVFRSVKDKPDATQAERADEIAALMEDFKGKALEKGGDAVVGLHERRLESTQTTLYLGSIAKLTPSV